MSNFEWRKRQNQLRILLERTREREEDRLERLRSVSLAVKALWLETKVLDAEWVFNREHGQVSCNPLNRHDLYALRVRQEAYVKARS